MCFFFFFCKTKTHTKGREKWVLTQKTVNHASSKKQNVSLSQKKKKKTIPTPRLHVLGPRLIETYIDPKKKKLQSIIPES